MKIRRVLASAVLLASGARALGAGAMLARALKGPMKNVEGIVFATRASYSDGHWYANIGYFCDNEKQPAFAGNGKDACGRLCRLDLRTGKITVLFDAKGGSVRDPAVHYDGDRVIFAHRPRDSTDYDLYETSLAGGRGSRPKRITSSKYDDYEPTYLPDGGIAFISTRCRRWVGCWKTHVGILYRCDADGSNVRQISTNIEHDNTPSVLPDGRIIYTRWEYVDRSQMGYHHLWTMNPDGTGQMVYYGNGTHGRLFIAARPIPGTKATIGVAAPGHGRRDHYGMPAVFMEKLGPDDRRGIREIVLKGAAGRGGRHVVDPWAFSDNCFIAGKRNALFIFDRTGNGEEIVSLKGKLSGNLHEPRPIMKRPRERVVPPRVDWSKPTGTLVLSDVYRGRHMTGVKRGDIKKLLILETLPKPANFSGGPDLVSWLGTFNLERVLGTVPVEEDGSAHFELPALRPVFFVALDGNDMSVKRMQSFTSVMPGETTSCVGCHERRRVTTTSRGSNALLALRRPPSRIASFEGLPDVLDFDRDIQPILDRHCVKCHGYQKREGKVLLEGGLGARWSLNYYRLLARRLVADGRNGLGNQPPRTIGTSASRLMKKIDGSHNKVKLTPREWRTVWLWIESGAPYAGTYGALRNAEGQKRGHPWLVFGRGAGILKRRCATCHGRKDLPELPMNFDAKDKRGVKSPTAQYERIVVKDDPLARFSINVLLDFTRPEKSPLLLGPLSKKAGGFGSCGDVFKRTDDRDYKVLLAALVASKKAFDAVPRFGTPGFRPNRQYVREMKRFGVLPPAFDHTKDPIDVFETDRKYWRSFWHVPPQ